MSQTQITLAGAFSALSVDVLVYPLDVIKTRLQADTKGPRKDLFRGLYRGIVPVVAITVPSACTFFLTYETLNSVLANAFSMPLYIQHLIASGTGELASCAVLTPIEVIKTRAQVSVTEPEGFFKAARKLNATNLRQGYIALAGRNLPYTALQFPLYERLRKVFAGSGEKATPKRKALAAAGGAACAGAFAATLTTPIDVIKTRVMIASSAPSISAVVQDIYREKGPIGFMRGALLRCGWSAFGAGVYLFSYETAKMWLKGEFDGTPKAVAP